MYPLLFGVQARGKDPVVDGYRVHRITDTEGGSYSCDRILLPPTPYLVSIYYNTLSKAESIGRSSAIGRGPAHNSTNGVGEIRNDGIIPLCLWNAVEVRMAFFLFFGWTKPSFVVQDLFVRVPFSVRTHTKRCHLMVANEHFKWSSNTMYRLDSSTRYTKIQDGMDRSSSNRVV